MKTNHIIPARIPVLREKIVGVTGIPMVVGLLGTVSKSLQKTGQIVRQKINQDHPDHSIVIVDYNIQGNPRDLKRPDVIQIQMKD